MMTPNHLSGRHALAATSRTLASFLSRTLDTLDQHIRAKEQEILRIKGLALRSEEQEHEAALSPIRTQAESRIKRFIHVSQKSS